MTAAKAPESGRGEVIGQMEQDSLMVTILYWTFRVKLGRFWSNKGSSLMALLVRYQLIISKDGRVI